MKIKFLFLITIFLFIFGCGEKLTKMSGKVTFPDGKPLSKGVVYFDDGKVSAKGPISPDGTFTMSFGGRNKANGLPPGQYKVYIQGAVNLVEKEVTDPLTGQTASTTMHDNHELLIDKKYTARASTNLEVTVTNKPETFDIVVDYPQ